LVLGLAFAALAWFDPVVGLWFSPITLGLLSSPWLISWTSSERLGSLAHALGFFWVPAPQLGEETPEPDS
ncbi:MAG: glucans biosynthesis glucosyltransferase MdoH, partial [Betaproteobacteria bacterium]|nr:glucans biosynthesis glucosyltransferase MdoH [Betaproteobacteria bacterium]